MSRRSSLSQVDVEASVTCMAKSVVRHPTWTSTGVVQSAESILTCLMLLGVIQPPPSSSPPSSSSPSSSSGSFSLSSSSDWSSGASDVSNLVSEDGMTSASCEQVNKHHQITPTANQGPGWHQNRKLILNQFFLLELTRSSSSSVSSGGGGSLQNRKLLNWSLSEEVCVSVCSSVCFCLFFKFRASTGSWTNNTKQLWL